MTLLLLGDTDSNPRTLFASGEQGGYYDPSVANTLFQLSDGVTAATQPGDPVGLILDSRKGGLSNLGSDLVTNGTFAADSDWTKGANWTIGSGVATKTGGAANNLTQTIASTAGAWYRLTMDVTRTAGTLTVSLGTSGTTYAISASGTYTFMILAGSSTQTLTLAGDSSFAGTIDNVTAKNVPGNHLYQPVSGSRGTLSREPDGGKRNLLTYTDTMSTQSLTVRAVQHTLSFTGTGTVTLSGASTAGPLVGTGASDVVSLTFTPTAASLTLTVSGTVTLAQLETGAARSGYQKNTTQYDCTESGKRDCWAIDFDGSDDSYSTSSTGVDFSATDKMTVWAGVWKRSDATQIVAELSASFLLNTGSFYLVAGADPSNGYTSASRGTQVSSSFQVASSLVDAPNQSVLSTTHDIASDLTTLRRNAVSATNATGEKGSGNFANAALYVGRRNNASFPFSGRIYGLIIRGAATTDSKVREFEKYIARITGRQI